MPISTFALVENPLVVLPTGFKGLFGLQIRIVLARVVLIEEPVGLVEPENVAKFVVFVTINR